MNKSNDYCQHEYKLDEEIGILCRRCGFVSSEIRDVSAPFVSLEITNEYFLEISNLVSFFTCTLDGGSTAMISFCCYMC